MNYEPSQFDERVFRNVSYDDLEAGQEFYPRRPQMTASGVDDTEPLKKVASYKNMKGQWINSKSKLGREVFTPYDQKVFVLSKV
jgi:hypothetical protein